VGAQVGICAIRLRRTGSFSWRKWIWRSRLHGDLVACHPLSATQTAPCHIRDGKGEVPPA